MVAVSKLAMVVAVALVLAAGCRSAEPTEPEAPMTMQTLTGTVAYRQRIALPPDAVVHVRLEDVSRADVLATIIAERRIATDGRQVPIPFSLEYDPARIDPKHRYNLRASIHSGGRMLFTTGDAHPVLTNGAGSDVNMLLQQVSGQDQPPVAGAGAAIVDTPWRLIEINGQPALPTEGPRPAGITLISKDDTIAANTSVNSMGGGYTLQGQSLTIEPGMMTMMAGPEPLMQQEQAFIAALKRVTGYRLENGGLSLVAGDEVVLRLERGE